MKTKEIYEKLETLKANYLAMEKKYLEYAKCVEQYELFLNQLNTFVYRLLVNKNYNVINGEAYFKENQEFRFEVDQQNLLVDLCEIINDFLKENEVGSLVIGLGEDNKPVGLTVKFNTTKKIKELEKELNNIRDIEKEGIKL